MTAKNHRLLLCRYFFSNLQIIPVNAVILYVDLRQIREISHIRVHWVIEEYKSSALVLVDYISGRCAGIHFDWPGGSVHVLGRMCPGFSGSRLRPPDMAYWKPAIMSRMPALALFEPQRGALQDLTPLEGQVLSLGAWRAPISGMPTGPEEFLSHWACLDYGSAPRPTS